MAWSPRGSFVGESSARPQPASQLLPTERLVDVWSMSKKVGEPVSGLSASLCLPSAGQGGQKQQWLSLIFLRKHMASRGTSWMIAYLVGRWNILVLFLHICILLTSVSRQHLSLSPTLLMLLSLTLLPFLLHKSCWGPNRQVGFIQYRTQCKIKLTFQSQITPNFKVVLEW